MSGLKVESWWVMGLTRAGERLEASTEGKRGGWETQRIRGLDRQKDVQN